MLKSSDGSVITTKTIYVTITRPSYTISFNANGGSGAPSSQTKYYNETLTLSSTVPMRVCYNFGGWGTSNTSTSASYQPGGSYTSNSGRTLYAIWAQNAISSGSSVSALISRAGQIYWYKFTPSSSGTYVIYSTGSADTKVHLYNSSGSEITNDDDGGDNTNFRLEYNLTSGTTYYYGVKYYSSSTTGSIPVKFGSAYTISYNANGGTGAPSSQKKDWGKDLTLSSTKPTKSGYTFLGWSTSSSATTATYQAGATFSSNGNCTLYAVWTANPFTVHYDANGGTGAPSDYNGVGPYTISTIRPTRIGYNFLGWSTSNTSTSVSYNPGANYTAKTNINLYAVWGQTTISSGSTVSATIGYGGQIYWYKFTPSSSGTYVMYSTGNTDTYGYLYNTSGTQITYNDDGGDNNNFRIEYNLTGGTTYYYGVKYYSSSTTGTISVKFGPVYTIAYNANGGSGAPSGQKKDWGKSITLSSSTPTYTGRSFAGWSTSSGSTTVSYRPGDTYSSDGNVTLYAVWKQNPHTVTYNYSYNGGTSATKTTASVAEGSSIDLTPTATKSGWTFVGWNTNSSATSALSSLKMGTSDVTLYAIYKKTLTGTFVDYNGTTKQTRTQSVTIYNKATNGTITAPSQNTYTGWTSRGWTTGTSADSGITTNFTISSNTTYYGAYQRTLTLSYNANGGSSTPSKQTGTQYTNSYAISSTKTPSFTLASAISKSGSTFSGWAKGSPSGTVYNAGSSISLTGNTTMYAVWNPTTNIYNLGEETYSFKNITSCSNPCNGGGHCFGMSVTSAAYYNNFLSKTSVGVVSTATTYSLSNNAKVREPICFYQNRQYNSTIVAGGRIYKGYSANASADWNDVVAYVKNQNYNGKGNLIVSVKKGGSGHAVNFLRYEEVNGQARIYVYDNNFPDAEMYFYYNSSDKKIYEYDCSGKGRYTFAYSDCIALRSLDKCIQKAGDFDGTHVIYAKDGEIEIEGAIANFMDCGDIVSCVLYEIPSNYCEVIITPLVDNAKFTYLDEEYSFGEIGYDTYGIFTLATNDDGAAGDEVTFTIINPPQKVKNVSVNDISINYKDSVTLKPEIKAVDGSKYTVTYDSSNPSVATVDKNGNVTTVHKGSATITCTVTDDYGNEVKDTCTVNVKFQWWQWLIWILLFGFLWY